MGGVKFVDNCGAILAPHRSAQHSNLQRWTRPRLRPRPLRMGGGLRAAKISARARANGGSGTEQSRNGAHATRFWDLGLLDAYGIIIRAWKKHYYHSKTVSCFWRWSVASLP